MFGFSSNTPKGIARRYRRDHVIQLVMLLTDGKADLDTIRRNLDKIDEEPTSAAEAHHKNYEVQCRANK